MSHVAQPPDDYRIFHVAMKVFEDERRFQRHRFQVAERLGRFFAVVQRLGTDVIRIVPSGVGDVSVGAVPTGQDPGRFRD